MIKLSPRLATCAAYIQGGGIVIDVGTDHGYLPCHLVSEGKCVRAYACDIAEGPLNSAREHILQSGLEDKITAVLSDGLLGLDDEAAASATDIVIAGMGGELIADILSKGIEAKKLICSLNSSARLILQPNSKAAFLRQFLAENAYEIISETAVRDGRFIYVVICAEFTGKADWPSLLEATVGKLDPRDPTAREYLEKEADKLRTAARGMAASAAEMSKKHADELICLAEGIENYVKENSK